MAKRKGVITDVAQGSPLWFGSSSEQAGLALDYQNTEGLHGYPGLLFVVFVVWRGGQEDTS